MSVSVSVKWGKEKFDVDVETECPPAVFKAQLFALTGVQPDRQKVMLRGKVVGDDNWDGVTLKKGSTLMMMGSADAIPAAPAKKMVFLEDMNEGQLASALDIPAGLKNLGNTCYMNATLQCLKSVPELRDALKEHRGNIMAALGGAGGGGMGGADAISSAVRDLFRDMDDNARRNQEVMPIIMLQVLHTVFPQFNTKDEHGHMQQQDANECWVELVRMLQQRLKGTESIEAAGASSAPSFITQYFGGRFKVSLKCAEAEEEPETVTTEDFYQLSCYLSQEVKYLHSGLKAKISETIDKRSPTLDRDAVYQKKSLLDRLPAYLSIQIVRFYYKEKDQVNAKILKDVKFPLILDVFDLSTPELQARLMPMRDRFKIADDKAMEALKAAKLEGKNVEAELANRKTIKSPYSFEDDVGSNNSGFYELQAVLTHKGRSSNSGHYVGWVRRNKNEWIMCDDENVVPVSEEDVLKLSGGGDWHCAYVLLYGPRILEEPVEEETNGNSVPDS